MQHKHNPMINSGAIACATILASTADSSADLFDEFMQECEGAATNAAQF